MQIPTLNHGLVIFGGL